jgi:dTDP-4-dehydrorhamnose reductase
MILVVGGTGMIGRALLRHAWLMGLPCSQTSRNHDATHYLDLAESPEKWNIPSGVENAIICASVTGIARCESNPKVTRQINVHATKDLIQRLSGIGATITFLSSNLVFPHDAIAPSESSTPNPASEYGRQKLAIEEFLLSSFPSSRIVRPTKVVSPSMPLFLKWIESLGHGQSIEAFLDLHFSPIALPSLADWVMKIARGKESGVFHLSAADSISYADAARWIAHRSTASKSLLTFHSAPVPNNPNTCRLSCDRTTLLTGFRPVSSLQNLEESLLPAK